MSLIQVIDGTRVRAEPPTQVGSARLVKQIRYLPRVRRQLPSLKVADGKGIVSEPLVIR